MMSTSSSSWRSSPRTDAGPRAKCDQVVYEAIAKAAEIVVQSRCGSTVNTTTTPSTSSSSSSRFNLHLAEIEAVRRSLLPFKKSLHVPLRLDVYYQHNSSGENNNTELQLLERWCLEYVPSSLDKSFVFVEECHSPDPLVQLRHVCKKMVLWLRTLYCSLLSILPRYPSHIGHNKNIGFSIYVSEEAQRPALPPQGFMQHQYSSVHTPYGRLDLEALYAPRRVIAQLFPKQPTARYLTTSPVSRPIPLEQTPQKQQQQRQQPQSAPVTTHHMNLVPDYTSTSPRHVVVAAKLAPQTLEGGAPPTMMQQQHEHHHVRTQSLPPPPEQQQPQQQPSYRREFHRSHSAVTDRDEQHGHPHEEGLQKRVLSGLSLAMMNADNNNENQDEATPMMQDNDDVHHEHTADVAAPPSVAPLSPRSEQRHAALHQPPPITRAPSGESYSPTKQHSQQQQKTTSSIAPGEYGYAYNNHIPWGHMPGNNNTQGAPTATTKTTTTTSSAPMRIISPMDSDQPQQSPQLAPYWGGSGASGPGQQLLVGTPPQPMFVGSTNNNNGSMPSPGGGLMAAAPGSYNSNTLIPPVKKRETAGGGAITPPFTGMPTTLVEAPKAPAMELHPHRSSTGATAPSTTTPAASQSGPPISSLDLLHTSPFKAQEERHGSVLSSLSGDHAFGGSLGGHNSFLSKTHNTTSDLFLRNSMMGQQQHHGNSASQYNNSTTIVPEETDHDMPFAVDDGVVATTTDAAAQHLSSLLVGGSTTTTSTTTANNAAMSSSAAVMAHKCVTASRLELFDSTILEQPLQQPQQQAPTMRTDDPMVSSLADQLAEFRSFGASLHHSTSGAGGAPSVPFSPSSEDETRSTSTPISLKT